jgi:hypothetical protein
VWDTLNTEYGGSDAGIELYIIELYHDYQMVDGKSVITQAHEIQCMVNELGHLKIVVPNEFVAGGFIAKLPPSWRDFATALKHKRVHMSISDLITSLDVEKKAQAKDGQSKGAEGQTSTNMVHQTQSHGKGKGKAKQNQNNSKPKQITLLKRRRRIRSMRVALYADLLIIGQKSVQTEKEENLNMSRRLRTWLYPALEVELVGMVIYHMFFQCFNLPLGGLILVQIFMCVLMLHYSLLTTSPGILL